MYFSLSQETWSDSNAPLVAYIWVIRGCNWNVSFSFTENPKPVSVSHGKAVTSCQPHLEFNYVMINVITPYNVLPQKQIQLSNIIYLIKTFSWDDHKFFLQDKSRPAVRQGCFWSPDLEPDAGGSWTWWCEPSTKSYKSPWWETLITDQVNHRSNFSHQGAGIHVISNDSLIICKT